MTNAVTCHAQAFLFHSDVMFEYFYFCATITRAFDHSMPISNPSPQITGQEVQLGSFKSALAIGYECSTNLM